MAVTENTEGSLRYDAVVVGAGPAGAAAARTLVEYGWRVGILEKKKLPRYKICSGLIVNRSQEIIEERFGSLPESVFSRPKLLKGARMCPADDTMIDVPAEGSGILNVWRSEFDHWLVEKSGAEILEEHEMIDFEQTQDEVIVHVRGKKDGSLRIKALYLIGADGASSYVRRLLAPDFADQIRYSIPTQLYCLGTINLEREYYYGFLDPSFSAFYAWLNFKDDYLVYGVAARKGDRIEPYLKKFTEYLQENFQLKIEKVVRKTGCMGSDMGIKGNFLLGRDRVLLVGEAAGFMNAFGEGISSALATGHIAAEAIHKAETPRDSAISLYRSLAESEQKMTTESWELANAIAGRKFQ
jgi:flavin-dependent dehydrogenase